ncbi:MAG: hypothetical protein IKM11_07210 [Oscillospiraceae bacterium]|nr:hypothetical protein [Oscillospiraceae bacterium]
MDLKKMIEELVEKIEKDPDILKKFNDEPVKCLEKLLEVDLPDDQVEKLIDGIKAKLTLDKVGDILGGLGGLFGKK